MSFCNFCIAKKEEKKLKRCLKCLNVFYCSRKCQKSDWKKHKIKCNNVDETLIASQINNNVKNVEWKDIVILIKSMGVIMNIYEDVRNRLKSVIYEHIIIYMRENRLSFSDVERQIRYLKLPYYIIAVKIPDDFYKEFVYCLGNQYHEPKDFTNVKNKPKYTIKIWTGYNLKNWKSNINIEHLKNIVTIFPNKIIDEKKFIKYCKFIK